MEVHHHPHVEKKGFKEYFLEFLMIFLAVTMGFFAEGLREHIRDNNQGKIYMRSWGEDLRKDTAQFANLIQKLKNIDSITDNIFNCYDSVSHHLQSTSCMNQVVPWLQGFPDFVYTDKTLQELKNAGGLRLISEKSVRDSIIEYDVWVSRELIHQQTMEIFQQKAVDATEAIINFSAFSKLSRLSPNNLRIELLQKDQQAIDRYFNMLIAFKKSVHSQIHYMVLLQLKATGMIEFLNHF
ncbi:MAG TPA: hypothetical protein VET23_05345 [Chitinophagaceae bacterium]|nr:hypothetical protein [Chitinophagaceae bacterium]